MITLDENEDTLDDCQLSHEDSDLKEGTRIDRYQVLQLLGKGGMGAVYKAYDPELDRSIAIKILTVRPHEGENASRPQARLMREAQALAKLSHPNVVAVHDVGSYEKGVYIAMEYVKGKTLREWIEQQKPNQKDIIRVLSKAGRGLQAAHAEGIVHRDFKPDNVLIGDKGQVKVLDFGLARAAGTEDTAVCQEMPKSILVQSDREKLLSVPLTRVDALVGTTVYMAPEHFQFQALDEKTDQFSFSVTFFEAIYGWRPFSGNTLEELGKNITAGSIDLPNGVDVPKWIEEIILKGLSVKKEDRFQSMAELLEALGNDPEITKALRRRKHFLWLSVVLGAVLFLGVGTLSFSRSGELCTGADRKIAVVWNEKQMTLTRQAFAKTDLSYARDTFVRVAQRFGDYLEKWKNDYTEVCQATRIRGEQSEEIMDLKMECLNRHLRNAKALLKIFEVADQTVVARAVQAVSSLSGFSQCDDVEALRSKIPPPKDETTKNKVEALREKLAEIEALERTGKYRDGLVLAEKLNLEANMVDYRPLQAEALYWRGLLLDRTGNYEQSETTLHDAALAAGESGNSLLATRALVLLVPVVGYKQSRYKEGLAIGQNAEVMLAVVGGNDEIRSSLLTNLGILFWKHGIYDKSLTYHRRALAIREKTLGPDHPDVALSLENIGLVFQGKGEYQKAFKHHRRALEIIKIAMGPVHPVVAISLNNLGGLFQNQNNYEKALEYYQQSLEVFEITLGSEHPNLAWPLSGIWKALEALGKPKTALEVLERLVQLCARIKCDIEPHARGLSALARSLAETDQDQERAIKLAIQARGLFEKNPKTFKKELQEVDVWLAKHDKHKGLSLAKQ